ncbi:MAG: IS110 family transposase [Candidatus Electrothrix sp. ATG1]|nr:IS110 family transposase [Candidatus Electrothrix sp. ATG1]
MIVATLISTDSSGCEDSFTKEFGTFTDELEQLREWLLEHECPVVAMESTGVYWRCVHNILEADFEVILVNARHVKNVPGRKTDIGDSRWLAGLLRHGLLRGSFIPPKEIRQWRELSRLRRKNRDTLSNYKRRVHKLFESANIKIGSVASDLFGVTGRNLITLLMTGPEDISLEDIEQCTRGSLRDKMAELHRSIQGFFEEHHRFQLTGLMHVISTLEQENASIDARMRELMKEHNDLIRRLDEVPGINELSAQYILSELGPELDTFPNAAALASWAGLCPGNNESAGKRHSGRPPVKKHPLKAVMLEVAWAAVKKKDTYYRDKYWRLRYRLGTKKAIVAIAHHIIKALFFIIKEGQEYRELGADYLEKKSKKSKLIKIRRNAKQFGFKLVPITA